MSALVFAQPAQPAPPEFDVASIKENRSLGDGGSLRRMTDGGIQAQHVSARSLLTIAFGMQSYQVLEAPGWSRETYYDIQAKPPQPGPGDTPLGAEERWQQTRAMMQTMLRDRFNLAVHREQRDLDGFKLQRVSPDRLGPNIKESRFNCQTLMATEPECRRGGISSASMQATGAPLRSLLQLVIGHVGAPVSDETGLTGTYDFNLEWTDELVPTDDRQSIYTALREQLGLRLQRDRVTEEVLIVDRFERATPD
jgi:uncharacterized protein (TIGR03435 family)